jgi:uncharacterized membrane protein YbhN (UPF0104 family)
MTRRRFVWTLTRVVLATAVVAIVLIFLDLDVLIDEGARLSWTAVLWAILFNVLTVLLLTARWFVAVRRFVPGLFWWHARHYWASIVFNLFTPAALGSDVYRILLLRGTAERGFSLFGLIVQERLIGLLGQAVFFMVCLVWLMLVAGSGSREPLPGAIVSAGWILLLVALVTLIVLWRGEAFLRFAVRFLPARWRERVHQVGTALRPPSFGFLMTLLAFTLLSVLTWTLAAAAIAQGLAAAVALFEVGLIAVLGEIARWLPLSVQGIGTREAVYAVGFELVAGSPEIGFLTGAIVYILNTLVLLLFGAVTLGYGWRKDGVT